MKLTQDDFVAKAMISQTIKKDEQKSLQHMNKTEKQIYNTLNSLWY